MAQYAELKEEAMGLLKNVVRLSKSAGATSLGAALESDRIARLQDERFHLVVLGEFNHGKTTFVNALLGKAVLPMGVTPTTAVIHRISYGDDKTATAVGQDGSEKTLPFDGLEAYEVDGAAVEDAVQHLDVKYPAPLLGEGVVLVDTPGVNDMNDARAEITYGYIPQSDAILFLLDAGQILKESERQFVQSKLLAASRDKVIFVVNKMDLLDNDEKQEALTYARTNLAKMIDDPKVFGISADGALSGTEGNGLPELLDYLKGYLKEERGRVLIDNALDAGIRTANTLSTGIEIQKRALGMEKGELERRLQALESDLEATEERVAERTALVRERVAAVKAVVRADVVGFGKRFGAALPSEIDAAQAKDLRHYLASFIEERFKSYAEEQAADIARRLEKVAEEAIAFVADDAKAQATRLREAFGNGGPELDLDVNTLAYDVGVFAVGAFGVTLMVLSNVLVGGALTLAAPVLAYVFRGRAEAQIKDRAREEAPKAVEAAALKMADAFDVRIDEFGEKLVAFVTQANEEMARSIAELVRAAKDAQAEGESALEELGSGAGMTLVKLQDSHRKMVELRESLWAS